MSATVVFLGGVEGCVVQVLGGGKCLALDGSSHKRNEDARFHFNTRIMHGPGFGTKRQTVELGFGLGLMLREG